METSKKAPSEAGMRYCKSWYYCKYAWTETLSPTHGSFLQRLRVGILSRLSNHGCRNVSSDILTLRGFKIGMQSGLTWLACFGDWGDAWLFESMLASASSSLSSDCNSYFFSNASTRTAASVYLLSMRKMSNSRKVDPRHTSSCQWYELKLARSCVKLFASGSSSFIAAVWCCAWLRITAYIRQPCTDWDPHL